METGNQQQESEAKLRALSPDLNSSLSRSPSPPRRRQFSRSPRPYSRSRVVTSLKDKFKVELDGSLLNSQKCQSHADHSSPCYEELSTCQDRPNCDRPLHNVDYQQEYCTASPSPVPYVGKVPVIPFRRLHSNISGMGTAGSESGTEADDELPKKLPAPPTRKRRRWDFESYEEEEGDDGPSARNSSGYFESIDTEAAGKHGKWKNRGVSIGGKKAQEEVLLGVSGMGLKGRRILFVQRGIEAGLMVVLIAIVMMETRNTGDKRTWRVVAENWAVETVAWLLTASVLLGRYIMHVRSEPRTVQYAPLPSPHQFTPGVLQLPRSLDPSPLLYPVLLPPLVGIAISPSLFLPNLVLSLASLPVSFFPDFSIYWALSLSPLLASRVIGEPAQMISTPSSISSSFGELLACLPFLQHCLTLTLAHILEPSLTITEIRLLSASLINLLIHTSSPQAVILKALLWHGGLGVMLLCSHFVVWNVQLARIPRHRFRRAANIVRGLNRIQNSIFDRRASGGYKSSSADEVDEGPSIMTMEKPSSSKQKIEFKVKDTNSGREVPICIELNPSTVGTVCTGKNLESLKRAPIVAPRKRRTYSVMSYYTHLTYAQALRRKYAYAGAVYLLVLWLIFFLLRPYIAQNALHGVDPFMWAASYLFCGIHGYSAFTTHITRLLGFLVEREGDGWTGCSVWADPKEWTISKYGKSEEEANRRLLMSGYFATILTLGIGVVMAVRKAVEVDTRRKVFHGMVVMMFLFVGIMDPQFTHLALSLVLAIFLLLDLFRAAQIPPISKPLSQFLTPFVDGRDLKGPVVVSHTFLLVGCALPIWFTHASSYPITESSPWKAQLSFVTGIISVGLGDSAASLIGRRFGKHKWGWPGGKSLEGSFAFMMAVFLGLLVGRTWVLHLNMVYDDTNSAANNDNVQNTWPLPWGGQTWGRKDVWFKLIAISAGASMMEAVVTGINDNVAVPVGLWLVIRASGL